MYIVQKNSSKESFPIVGIGASAGGLEAIRQLLETLPENVGSAFVIIQHLASNQKSMLSDILSRHTKMAVTEVKNGEKIKPNNVYVIPSGKIMTISNGLLKLKTKKHQQKPINIFFKSLAKEKTIQAIGVILSGTGTDGTDGLQAIKTEGGITFAQDPKTADYPSMPRNAISAETVHYILSPSKIAKKIVNIANHPEMSQKQIEIQEPSEKELSDNEKIFWLLKKEFNVNFNNYKKATINRRIARRIVLNGLKNKKDYLDFLRSHKEETSSLFQDLLINVTDFFREPETFKQLKEKVLPEIGLKKPLQSPIRVWVPGCSTGEEVYSIAIIIHEYLEQEKIVDKKIQIFGTDVNGINVEKARKAIYPKSIEETVSEERLQRFFSSTNGKYQVSKPIRDMCVFAKHDIIKDPPFSKMDLVVCRNLLIYFKPKVQEKIIPILHYALKSYGYLVLGQSESIGRYTNLFKPLTGKGLIFKRKEAQPTIEFGLPKPIPNFSTGIFQPSKKIDSLLLLQKAVDNLLLSEYVPAAMILNNNLEVIVIRGDVDPYISIDAGVASLNVTKIVRKEIRPAIQTAVYIAKKEKRVVKEIVRLENPKEANKIVNISVNPIKLPKYDEKFYLILFQEIEKPSIKNVPKGISEKETMSAKDRQILELTEELATSKGRLQTVIEQQEATNEELRSSLEEAQSSNEELMSTNEELETTKEELQSTNEELTTLNDELRDRNQRLNQLNDDLTNLMNNIDTAVVIVDNNFKIRRFTDSAQKLLRLIPGDVGHPITDIRLGIPVENLEKQLLKVTNKLKTIRGEIKTPKKRWYQLRIRPYLTHDKKVDGAILSFADITELKTLEEQINTQTQELIEAEGLAAIGKTAGMVGHDIRNPLQAIEGEIYLAKQDLEDSVDSETKKQMQESLARIENRIHYINKIVKDLQDYAKKLDPAPEKINLQKLLNQILEMEHIKNHRQVTVSIDPNLPKLFLDRNYLTRILTNLITNAIQATSEDGLITISAFSQNDKIVITVEDNGIGMTKETKNKIFTPLFTTKAKGQGFGLAVVKRLTEVMDGTIKFESKVNNGSKFTLEFPMTETDET